MLYLNLFKYNHLFSGGSEKVAKMRFLFIVLKRQRVVCCCLVAKSCLSLCDPMGCSQPGSSVHGILQARILEWAAVSFSRGSSRPRDWTSVSCIGCIGRQTPYRWATREAQQMKHSCGFKTKVITPPMSQSEINDTRVIFKYANVYQKLKKGFKKNHIKIKLPLLLITDQ